MPELFDMRLRALRRDGAARNGPELFLYERAFEDCLDRIGLIGRPFERALLIGCPDPGWPERLRNCAVEVEVRDPGPSFAQRAGGDLIIEDGWEPPTAAFDLVLAIGTLDTVDDLPLALRLICHGMRPHSLFMGAFSGGDTLPELRKAMRAADAVTGAAAPHVHPRIEPSALAPLLEHAGFVSPVIDTDRVAVSYQSLDRLIADLRRMGATNVLRDRPRFIRRSGVVAAATSFAASGDGQRTIETFEILHLAAWSSKQE